MRPCPMCGGEARVQSQSYEPSELTVPPMIGKVKSFVKCSGCGLETRWHCVTTGRNVPTDRDVAGAEKLATAAWDRRVTP